MQKLLYWKFHRTPKEKLEYSPIPPFFSRFQPPLLSPIASPNFQQNPAKSCKSRSCFSECVCCQSSQHFLLFCLLMWQWWPTLDQLPFWAIPFAEKKPIRWRKGLLQGFTKCTKFSTKTWGGFFSFVTAAIFQSKLHLAQNSKNCFLPLQLNLFECRIQRNKNQLIWTCRESYDQNKQQRSVLKNQHFPARAWRQQGSAGQERDSGKRSFKMRRAIINTARRYCSFWKQLKISHF